MRKTEMNQDKRLLQVRDLQEILNIGRDTAYALMHNKSFPSTQIGGRYYVSASALEEWLNKIAYKKVTL